MEFVSDVCQVEFSKCVKTPAAPDCDVITMVSCMKGIIGTINQRLPLGCNENREIADSIETGHDRYLPVPYITKGAHSFGSSNRSRLLRVADRRALAFDFPSARAR